jgi:hypothetical protein
MLQSIERLASTNHLETDKSFVLCRDDRRHYNQDKLYKFIKENTDKTILFFCDNRTHKIMIKDKYPFIIVTDYDIGHTSLSNTTDLQVFNTITDFYLLSNSEHIYKSSHSGFSVMASKFRNIACSDIT